MPTKRDLAFNQQLFDNPILMKTLSIFASSSYVGQTGRQFGTRMKEHKGAVRRQDENSLLALHCLTSGHAFDWDRATVMGNGTSKYKRELVEAWNTTSTCPLPLGG